MAIENLLANPRRIWGILGGCGGIWGDPGRILGGSWGAPEGILGDPGGILGDPEGILGGSWVDPRV